MNLANKSSLRSGVVVGQGLLRILAVFFKLEKPASRNPHLLVASTVIPHTNNFPLPAPPFLRPFTRSGFLFSRIKTTNCLAKPANQPLWLSIFYKTGQRLC